MVAVSSTGSIHYAVQFPGESLSSDYLPPAEGALTGFTPPMYVVLVLRPTGVHTFNKMTAFLIAHLAIFSPGAKLPNWSHILDGAPRTAITISGYQYNLKGELLPVPRQFYNDRHLPPPPMRIESPKGELLSTIQFVPWQDGGTVLLKGKLPLRVSWSSSARKDWSEEVSSIGPLISRFRMSCRSRRRISTKCSTAFSAN